MCKALKTLNPNSKIVQTLWQPLQFNIFWRVCNYYHAWNITGRKSNFLFRFHKAGAYLNNIKLLLLKNLHNFEQYQAVITETFT